MCVLCVCADENQEKSKGKQRICETWADSSKKIETACEDSRRTGKMKARVIRMCTWQSVTVAK